MLQNHMVIDGFFEPVIATMMVAHTDNGPSPWALKAEWNLRAEYTREAAEERAWFDALYRKKFGVC